MALTGRACFHRPADGSPAEGGGPSGTGNQSEKSIEFRNDERPFFIIVDQVPVNDVVVALKACAHSVRNRQAAYAGRPLSFFYIV